MSTDLLFSVAFVCQIWTLSIYFPHRTMATARRALAAQAEVPVAADPRLIALRRYVLTERAVAAFGLLLLILFFTVDVFGDVRATLLGIGLLFALQVVPLAALSVPRHLSSLTRESSRKTGTRRVGRRRLFDAVSPLAVATACVLAVAYLGLALSHWQGGLDAQLVKITVYLTSNTLFAAAIAWNLTGMTRPAADERADTDAEAIELVPAFVYLSIGISLYYFGKQLVADFDLQQLRPFLMTLWMQVLAVLAFQRILRR